MMKHNNNKNKKAVTIFRVFALVAFEASSVQWGGKH